MATTIGELLDTAQTCLWQAAGPLPPTTDPGARGGTLAELYAGWPALAAAARRAVTTFRTGIRPENEKLLAELDRLPAHLPPDQARPHPHLVRAAVLLGAAADAAVLTGHAYPPDTGPLDRVAAAVEAAATLTAL